jgi:hypothetical protein
MAPEPETLALLLVVVVLLVLLVVLLMLLLIPLLRGESRASPDAKVPLSLALTLKLMVD